MCFWSWGGVPFWTRWLTYKKKRKSHTGRTCLCPRSPSTADLLNFHQARVITMLGSEGLAGSLGKSFKMSRNVQASIVLKWNRGLLDYLLQGTLAWSVKDLALWVSPSFYRPKHHRTFHLFQNKRKNKRSTLSSLNGTSNVFSFCFHSQSTRNLIS